VLETVWELFKKFNKELPYDPAIPFLPIYSKELKTGILTNICT